MMHKTLLKTAPRLLLGALALSAATQAAHSSPFTEIHYRCDGAQMLVVRQSGEVANVQFVGRSYLLKRAHSSIGDKFLAPKAALIIDGRTAVFVAEDRLQLGQCVEVSRMASAR